MVYSPVKHETISTTVRHFKILDATEPFNEMVRAHDVIIMASGTPTTELLAEPGTYALVQMPHPIAVARRQICYIPVGSMNKDQKRDTTPRMAVKIAELHKYYNRNTIVHCGTYEIAENVFEYLKDKVDNVICQDRDTKQEDFDEWQSLDDCVFLSVAMEQGIDLKGSKYPLNIIMKVNFPYLGDEWIQYRNKYDNKKWYYKTTALNIVQACGRTTRDLNDFSETYILDKSFKWFYESNKKLFPQWFHAALVVP